MQGSNWDSTVLQAKRATTDIPQRGCSVCCLACKLLGLAQMIIHWGHALTMSRSARADLLAGCHAEQPPSHVIHLVWHT